MADKVCSNVAFRPLDFQRPTVKLTLTSEFWRMKIMVLGRTAILLAIVTVSPPAMGQCLVPAGGPFTATPVTNAPFSADAITKVRVADGTAHEYTVTARYYRNSQGWIRAEVDTPSGPYILLDLGPGLTADGHWRGPGYRLDPAKRTYRLAGGVIDRSVFNGEGRAALPLGNACFQSVRRVAGESDAERLEAVHAQVAPDLGIVVASHRADAIASVDYKVTNIRREEPPATLFEVPADYTLVAQGSRENPIVVFAPWQSPPACKPVRP
jgi:hypothetical protein